MTFKFHPGDQDIVWRVLRDFPQAGANVTSADGTVEFTGRGDEAQERGAIQRFTALNFPIEKTASR